MDIAESAEPASWIPGRLHPFSEDVGSVIPVGFAAYARVFHPPYRLTSEGKEIPVRWSEIAAANNRTIAAELQLLGDCTDPTQFSSSGEELWQQQAGIGRLPRHAAERLVPILAAHTRTPDSCWFAVWDGWGDFAIRHGEAAGFSIPNRDLLLLHGAVNDVLTTLSEIDWIYLAPNLWWPDDRTWCVATEIDLHWSYVGGSRECIAQVLADPELEVLPTTTEQGNFMEK